MSMSSEKSGDQAEGFGERGAAFEQKARATIREFMEKRVQRPTDPEVLFEVAFVGAEPGC